MLNILNNKVISVSEISERIGFAPDDIIIELQRRGIAPIRMGNNFYLTADMLSVLFSQDNTDIFVTNQPICATDIDNRPSAELSLPQLKGREVLRVANATISFVSKEGRKKPYMVQRRVYFEDGGFKRVSKCFATREEAEAYVAKVDGERERIVPCPESVHIVATVNSRQAVCSNMSFYDFMRYFIKDSGQCTCGDRTKKCYMDTTNRIHKELDKIGMGSITLGELDDTVLNKVIKNIADCGDGDSLLDKVYNFTKRVLRYAFAKEYIGRDISLLIRKAKSRKQEGDETDAQNRNPYSDEEIKMLLDAAKPNIRLYAIIILALYSGMRPAEIRALRWKDIDWSNGVIRINGAVKRKYGDVETSSYSEFVGSTKSSSGIRVIPLADRTAAALKDWRAESEKTTVGRDSEFIFFSKNGGAMNESQYSSMWRRFINSHSWKGRGYFLYRFRHTFCTRLLLNDSTHQEVKALMGDSSLKVIEQNYNGIRSQDVLERSRETVNGIF